MPLTPNPHSTPPVRRSKYETERNERHAAVQKVGDDNRRSRNAPRRDDLARAAYYVLLLTLAEARAQGEIEKGERIRRRMRLIMEDAFFDPEASMEAFDDHAKTVIKNLEGWVGMRKIAQQKRLKDEARRSAAE